MLVYQRVTIDTIFIVLNSASFCLRPAQLGKPNSQSRESPTNHQTTGIYQFQIDYINMSIYVFISKYLHICIHLYIYAIMYPYNNCT